MTCLFDILQGRLLYMWYLSAIPNRARQAICRYRGASAHKRRAGEGLPPANGLPLGSTRKPEPQQSRKTVTGNRKGSLCSNPTIRMATCQTGGIESQQRSQGAATTTIYQQISNEELESQGLSSELSAGATSRSVLYQLAQSIQLTYLYSTEQRKPHEHHNTEMEEEDMYSSRCRLQKNYLYQWIRLLTTKHLSNGERTETYKILEEGGTG
ncbi:hypothetical protein M431DRAFT_538162 [Trichoderma harzianum CBS 226.95]|uniref:Uncharacterized protein n=1 Tax=Trichoderma harzianum CBS 226.95 TaxID=983964 RepID=A0A2T4AVC0_TRIHA|nr:hypothetical protein M431DRAFT_538162 [Trichoderma harzianum CBS 226.95]PTB61010.1 hypothetical protein M431DRAFT_538162 [Trichoderma harzianum CBS 226.95]